MKHESPLMNAYQRLPIAFVKGEGVWLWDSAGKRYLDALSGVAVCGLGHAHPAVTQAITEQAGKLLHTSNIYEILPQQELGKLLVQISGMENCFFSNSGAEANEAAIKIARLYGHQKGIEIPTIIVMEGAFHGRTMATLTATANPKIRSGFEPLVPGFVRVPFDDIAAIEKLAQQEKNIVAILVEPVQGEGGIRIPAANYLTQLRALCDKHQWLLMLDEIQTANGRTGRYFAYQHHDILPDVVTTAKGLGNGVPIGVCLARGKAAQVIQPGTHGSTFGGNLLACATGLAVVKTILTEKISEHAAKMGDYLQQQLQLKLKPFPQVKTIRHQGLMLGVELDRVCKPLVAIAAQQGLLINVTADSVIRLLPPLIITEAEADQIATLLAKSLQIFLQES